MPTSPFSLGSIRSYAASMWDAFSTTIEPASHVLKAAANRFQNIGLLQKAVNASTEASAKASLVAVSVNTYHAYDAHNHYNDGKSIELLSGLPGILSGAALGAETLGTAASVFGPEAIPVGAFFGGIGGAIVGETVTAQLGKKALGSEAQLASDKKFDQWLGELTKHENHIKQKIAHGERLTPQELVQMREDAIALRTLHEGYKKVILPDEAAFKQSRIHQQQALAHLQETRDLFHSVLTDPTRKRELAEATRISGKRALEDTLSTENDSYPNIKAQLALNHQMHHIAKPEVVHHVASPPATLAVTSPGSLSKIKA